MTVWERFNNRILSTTPAAPGWHVETQHVVSSDGKTTVSEKTSHPVVLWAVVETAGPDGETFTQVEPVFYDGTRLINATECRRMNSNVDPDPGEPKEVVRIEVKRAADEPAPHAQSAIPSAERSTHLGDAILITEDGTVTTVNLPADREIFAKYTAAILRCSSIEAFDLAPGIVVWIDEDGRGRWGYNALADNLINRYGHTGSLAGPVLITGYGARVKALTPQDGSRLLRELSDDAS